MCRFAFLPVELCGAHYLSIEQLAALKYLPSLLYRVEVRYFPGLFSGLQIQQIPNIFIWPYIPYAAMKVCTIVFDIQKVSGATHRLVQGLLVATEFRNSAYPRWLPPQVHEPPFVLKVLEALTTEGCRDNIDHERCAHLPHNFSITPQNLGPKNPDFFHLCVRQCQTQTHCSCT